MSEYKDIDEFFNEYKDDLGKEDIKKILEIVNKKECFIDMKRKYEKEYKYMKEYSEVNESYKEFAIGGSVIHRGYYCPSPVQDIIIGRNNRGRLIKRVSATKEYTYEYSFDKNKKLVRVEEFFPDINSSKEELFHYESDIVFSFIFENIFGKNTIQSILICRYERGRIIQYDCVHFMNDMSNDFIFNICSEEYGYQNNLLKVVDYYNISPDKNGVPQHFTHLRYTFDRDEHGYLSTYTGGNVIKDMVVADDKIYGVLVKRK